MILLLLLLLDKRLVLHALVAAAGIPFSTLPLLLVGRRRRRRRVAAHTVRHEGVARRARADAAPALDRLGDGAAASAAEPAAAARDGVLAASDQ